MIRVLVVEDQNTIRQVLKRYLESEPDLEIVGFAPNGQVAIEKVKEVKPDVVLMDVDMPVMNGLTATKIISERFFRTKVLILTIHDEEKHLNRALQVGARGYLLKNTPSEELVNAIRYVQKGYFQLGPGLIEKYLHKILKLESKSNNITKLNKRLDYQSNLNQEIEKKINDEVMLLLAQNQNMQFKFDAIENRILKLERSLYLIYIILILTALIGAMFISHYLN